MKNNQEKNKNDEKNKKIEEKNKRKKSAFAYLIGASCFAVAVLFACQFIFVDNFSNDSTFMQNTTINGVDVSGMTQKQAENILSYNLLKNRDQVHLNLSYEDSQWKFSGSDFSIANDIENRVSEVFEKGKEGGFFEKRAMKKASKNQGLSYNISYKTVLGGIDTKIEEMIDEIEQDHKEAEVVFCPDEEQIFSVRPAVSEVRVDREKLMAEIDEGLALNMTAEIEIPTIKMIAQTDENEILSKIGLRGRFSTNYAKSTNNRKFNIQKALSVFNGIIMNPNDEISFNETTGPRSTENGYKKANIILNGAYVEGAGGGVCQASTTLYNAVVLSGLDVTDKSNHSLPASYVPLSFDAMVSEGTSDLVFVNNYDFPIYIRTYGTDTEAIVEIYGNKFENGEEIKTRAELVKILPHGGDKIIPDTNLEYEQFVIYKGEYHRVKYPKEGYESKGYIQFLKDGEVLEEREIRHDYYMPQEGIIAEGIEEVPNGITLPKNNVEFIPPQKVTKQNTQNLKAKIEKENPVDKSP